MSIGGEPYDASQRERLTQRYRPQQLNADAFGNPVVHVSDQTWENLANAQRIIDRLREWMPYGAGNQHWDIQHTQGESIKRQELGRKDGYSCLQTGAGNCSEFADIGTKLAGSEIRNQPVMTAKAQGLDHMVTLIGDHREVGKDNVTVQDAWPSYATAYTWGQGVVNEYEPRGASRHEDFNPGEYQKPMSSQLVDHLFEEKIDPDFSLADEYQYFPDKIYTQRTFGGDMSTRYVSDAHPEGRVFDSIPSYYVRKYDDYIKQNDDFGGPLFARRNPMR